MSNEQNIGSLVFIIQRFNYPLGVGGSAYGLIHIHIQLYQTYQGAWMGGGGGPEFGIQ